MLHALVLCFARKLLKRTENTRNRQLVLKFLNFFSLRNAQHFRTNFYAVYKSLEPTVKTFLADGTSGKHILEAHH